jgi:hypothetical protein
MGIDKMNVFESLHEITLIRGRHHLSLRSIQPSAANSYPHFALATSWIQTADSDSLQLSSDCWSV